MKSPVVAFLAWVFVAANAYALERGTLALGGTMRVPLKWDAFGHMTVGADVAPTAAYFIMDQLELFTSLRVQGPLYQSEFVQATREPVRYGIQFGANYYFDFGLGFFPYLGCAGGAEVADFKPISTQIYLELPVGIAFLVRERLMIQIGAPIKVLLAPPGPTLGTAHVEWTPGSISARIFL